MRPEQGEIKKVIKTAHAEIETFGYRMILFGVLHLVDAQYYRAASRQAEIAVEFVTSFTRGLVTCAMDDTSIQRRAGTSIGRSPVGISPDGSLRTFQFKCETRIGDLPLGGLPIAWRRRRKNAADLPILIIVLPLLMGGGGGYYGYSRWGYGGGLGIVGRVLLIFLVIYLLGGLRFGP